MGYIRAVPLLQQYRRHQPWHMINLDSRIGPTVSIKDTHGVICDTNVYRMTRRVMIDYDCSD